MPLHPANYAGGNTRGDRHARDFYRTPEWVVDRLLSVVHIGDRTVWEPACGDGAIVERLASHGCNVVGTDIHDYGSNTVLDFLQATDNYGAVVVTNPPFVLAEEFITKCFELGIHDICLLLKSDFWAAKRRKPLFEKHPPACVYALTKRADFKGMKRPVMNVCWNVWQDGQHDTKFRLL